jgi:hypothetical protein
MRWSSLTKKQDIKQAQADAKKVAESTEELIDMPMYEFCQFFDDKNVGECRAFRSLLQMHLDRVDHYGKNAVEANLLLPMKKEERISMASLFSLASKIQDRMGYIDYLLLKRKIK